MAILDFFRKAPLNPFELKDAPRVHVQQTTPYHNRSDNFKSYAKEGYQQNAEQGEGTLFNKLANK